MLWFYPARLNQEVRVVCNAPRFTPKWHSVCTETWICVYTQIHATLSAWAFITPVTGCVIAQLRSRPCWALTRRLFRVPSVTQSGSMWSCRYQHVSCRHRTQTPLNPFKGHESRRFWSAVYKSHVRHRTVYPLPRSSVCGAEEIRQWRKPISSVRSALILSRSSRMCGVEKVVTGGLCSAKPKSRCQTEGARRLMISYCSYKSACLPPPCSSSLCSSNFSFPMSLFSSDCPQMSFLCSVLLHLAFYGWVSLSQFISLCPWVNYWFN